MRWAHGLVEDVVQSNEDGENAWLNGTPFRAGSLGGGSRLSGDHSALAQLCTWSEVPVIMLPISPSQTAFTTAFTAK